MGTFCPKTTQLFVSRRVVQSRFEDSDSTYKTVVLLPQAGQRNEREKRHEIGKQNRQVQDISVIRLNEVVQYLRDEVNNLQIQHNRLLATIPAVDGMWDTVMGYFRVVRYRLPLSVDLLRLVSKTMASNVVYNSEYGIEAMIRSWYFLQWLGDVHEELENVTKTANNSMVANTRTTVAFPTLVIRCESEATSGGN
ncbi:hypothetical protein PHMEG_00030481 [Phytophthora megakarya]|uniref:Bzip transcription factor n=1 Tax=Phytophthora megakarya TaxID=4795 RepID=A0A225V0J6_9STRA|nr:hypothetical protein PHMEG_00030481 [Phytophthora megakarya]